MKNDRHRQTASISASDKRALRRQGRNSCGILCRNTVGHNHRTPRPTRSVGEIRRFESLTLYRKARDERDALRAKIAEMERQEPVATVIKEGDSRYWMSERLWTCPDGKYPLYAILGAQQCKNCNGMGDRFDPSGEKIPCDLCESHLEEIRSLVAEAAHDIISGSDFWLSISLAAKKIYALLS